MVGYKDFCLNDQGNAGTEESEEKSKMFSKEIKWKNTTNKKFSTHNASDRIFNQ